MFAIAFAVYSLLNHQSSFWYLVVRIFFLYLVFGNTRLQSSPENGLVIKQLLTGGR